MVSVSDFDAPAATPVPPQNLEAEESVLGAAMLSPGAIEACRDVLSDDGREFYRESHARIWRAVLAIADQGEPVDAITLTEQLEQRGHLDDVGGRVRLHELAALVPATANAGHYARIVVETAQLRALIRLGGEIARLGWERPGEPSELLERARGLAEQLDNVATPTTPIELETWAQFERSATEHVPTIVDGLWPSGGLGFIAAPPKKGKTWVGLSLAVAVATGKPFLASFQVEKPEPVVYLALEGHRAAIRGRIGCLARGLDIDPYPERDELGNLHIVYKPRGLNLADPAWVRTIRDTVQRVDAKLVIVDVLRAAAVVKENSNDEFRDLIRVLQPLQDQCAIAMLHHFGKLTEISRDRSPGERMAGAGAMYGAFDVGVFITASEDGGRTLRLEFETRDLANPDTIGVHLAGEPTGRNGGFIYTDQAYWTSVEAPGDRETENVADFVDWLAQQPDRRATTSEIIYAFGISDRSVRRKRQAWVAAGVEWTPARGQTEASFSLPERADTERTSALVRPPMSAQETLDLQEKSTDTPQGRPRADTPPFETPDLQAQPRADRADSPTESVSAVTGHTHSDFDLEDDVA